MNPIKDSTFNEFMVFTEDHAPLYPEMISDWKSKTISWCMDDWSIPTINFYWWILHRLCWWK